MTNDASVRPRVLVVDDDPRLLHIVNLYLEVQGLAVSLAGDGGEAYATLSQELPDLLITDVMMPVMDGVTLVRRVRELPGATRLPIIVFTALDTESDLRAARDAGADRVITKPFDLANLGDVVHTLLRSTRVS